MRDFQLEISLIEVPGERNLVNREHVGEEGSSQNLKITSYCELCIFLICKITI